MKKINLLDLFSGIGGFHLGLSQAGFKVNSFYSEIDKYALKTYKHNFKFIFKTPVKEKTVTLILLNLGLYYIEQ